MTAYGLKAPGGVKAVISEGRPLITWKASANATHYEIYRAAKSGGYVLIGTSEELSFTDNDELTPFTKYYYKVKAVDDWGNKSALSSYVYVTSYGIKAPGGVKAVVGEGRPLITWGAAVNATHYEVYRAVKGGEYVLIGTTDGLSFTDNDELLLDTLYYYKVKALDDYGFESPLSTAASVTT